MERFKNILVAVDLSQGDRFVSNDLPVTSIEAVERALWLAKLNSARVSFFYALDVSPGAQRLIEESEGGKDTVLEEAQFVLRELVARSVATDVTASSEVRIGKSWLEIIRKVLRDDHDLVVAGTRHLRGLQGVLMGSTGMKLLRKCPCPVWISRPQPESEIKSILVAHCLREVGDTAMELGCSMAELRGAELHILHSLEFPEMEFASPPLVTAETSAKYHSKARQHIDAQLARYKFAHPPQVHIVAVPPDVAVLEHVENYGIRLLTLGTVARTGIAGLITGNTAERLLPQIPCSVLAVKPQGFVSPVLV